MENNRQTSCACSFWFQNAGEVKSVGVNEDGREFADFAAEENSFFEPDEITGIMGIEPCKTRRMGDPINEKKRLRFSLWEACRIEEKPCCDAKDQVLQIVRVLKPLIPRIKEVKQKFNVISGISMVADIYDEKSPAISFDREIIEFCYLTDTEIFVDAAVFDRE